MKKLPIDLNLLPEEGKSFSGSLDKTIYELSEKDAQPSSDMEYDIFVQRFEEELLVRGSVESTFEFVCVRDNAKFLKTIFVDDFALTIAIDASVIDLANSLREEVLILFPDYPRCDEGDEERECKLEQCYLVLDKEGQDSVENSFSSNEQASVWNALDDIKKI